MAGLEPGRGRGQPLNHRGDGYFQGVAEDVGRPAAVVQGQRLDLLKQRRRQPEADVGHPHAGRRWGAWEHCLRAAA